MRSEGLAAVGPPRGSERLRLREFEPGDRHALVAMHREPRVRTLLLDDAPLDHPVVAHEFIVRMQRYHRRHEGLGIWCAERWLPPMSAQDLANPDVVEALSPQTIVRMSTPAPRFIGWFNLMRMPASPDDIEIGCRLLPREWGTRIVFEGGALLLDHAFDRLGLARVYGVCHPDHRSVAQVLLGLGFEPQPARDYEGRAARWYAIDEDHWRTARTRPLGLRLRESRSACTSPRAARPTRSRDAVADIIPPSRGSQR